MLAAALEAEVAAYIEAHAGERDERGRRLVVRNGHAEPRTIATGAGPIEIEAPRVNDKRVDAETGERLRFRSSIVPPWCRKSPKVAEVLPLMYLHGMSSGDFVPALEEFLGSAAGLSSSVIIRLTKQWQAERDAFMRRDLSGVDYVYMLGRRHPLQHPPGGGTSLLPRGGGRARRRDQGARRHPRLPRVNRQLG